MIGKLSLKAACCVGLVALAGCELPEAPDFRKDVRAVCETLPKAYAYFEGRAPYWDEACAARMAELGPASTGADLLASLETLIDDLYEPHMSLTVNSATSPYLVPSGADVWFEARGDAFVVTAIRAGSGAAQTDLVLGDTLVRFNGLDPDALMRTRISAGADHLPEARTVWALNAAIAGNRGAPREIEVMRGNRVLAFALGEAEPAPEGAALRYRKLGGNIGYIRFHNSLGDADTVTAFSGVMAALAETDGLILDLRDTPGGGNTDVAEPILGHFVQAKQAYQMVAPVGKKAYLREVAPFAGHHYDKPLIVLVGRWTGSMGEGMAVGLDGMERARVMGDRMAGLAGGTEELALGVSGMTLSYPAYGLNHIDGTPRHDWSPSPQQAADFGDGDDLLLQAARAELGGS